MLFFNSLEANLKILMWLDRFSFFPNFIDGLATSSIRAQDTVFFKLWGMGFPLSVLIMVPRIINCEKRGWLKRWKAKGLRWHVFSIVAVVFLILGAVAGFLIPGDPSFCNGCTTDSALGLYLIYGILCPVTISLLIALVVCLFISFFAEISSISELRRGK